MRLIHSSVLCGHGNSFFSHNERITSSFSPVTSLPSKSYIQQHARVLKAVTRLSQKAKAATSNRTFFVRASQNLQNGIQSLDSAQPISISQFRIGPYDGVSILLSIMACTVSIATTVIFVFAIPALQALKKTARALEKLADSLREELPSTMAAVRLSGMEISDLTMELSDLSQEITEGVRSSARAVQAAEDGIRKMKSYATTRTSAALHERATTPSVVGPAIATVARTTRQAVSGVRQAVRQVSVVGQVAGWVKGRFFKQGEQSSEEEAGSFNANSSKGGALVKGEGR